MFKIAGILLLMTGCTGLGINKVIEEKRRIHGLREIRRMVIRIQNEMIYGKRTLPEICLLFADCMEEPFKGAFLNIFNRLEENDGCVLENIWKEKLGRCMSDMPLKEDEKEVLLMLPVHPATLDETMQAVNIGQSLDLIEERIRKAEAGYENKSRVIMSISVMAGIFLVILFL